MIADYQASVEDYVTDWLEQASVQSISGLLLDLSAHGGLTTLYDEPLTPERAHVLGIHTDHPKEFWIAIDEDHARHRKRCP